MPRYLFNAYSGLCHGRDFEILDLPNLDAACAQAPRVARQFRAYLPGALRQEDLMIEIVEETGREFRAMRFGSVT